MALFDYAAFPTLATERLVLRELLPSDAEDVFVFRSDAEVQKFNSEPMKEVREALALIEDLRADYAARKGVLWGVTLRERNQVLGLIGFNTWNRYHRRAEIGYDLARAHWGQGIASEAVKAILAFGFDAMELHRVEACTIADNFRSARMLEKLGFQREGTQREFSWEEDGTFHDSAIYGILQQEFTAA